MFCLAMLVIINVCILSATPFNAHTYTNTQGMEGEVVLEVVSRLEVHWVLIITPNLSKNLNKNLSTYFNNSHPPQATSNTQLNSHGLRGKVSGLNSLMVDKVLSALWKGGIQVKVADVVDNVTDDAGNNIKESSTHIGQSLTDIADSSEYYMAVLVIGHGDWVTNIALMLNRMILLGPRATLVLCPSSGWVSREALALELRLAAKVVLLKWDDGASPEGTTILKGMMAGASCICTVQHAFLLPRGTYTFRTAGCWDRDMKTLHLLGPISPGIHSLKGASVSVIIIKNFFEAIRVGPRRSYLVGYLGKIINALAKSLQFRYVIMEGTSFGILTPNGTYDGVIGHAQRKEGDIGLASLSITDRRSRAIDFTAWLRFQPTLFVTRGPMYLKDYAGVFRLYSWQVWCIIPGFLVFSAVWVWLLWPNLGAKDPKSSMKDSQMMRGTGWSERPLLSSVTASLLKAVVYQGSVHVPQSTPARIVYVCTWLVCVVLMAVYSGNLTAFLFTPALNLPPYTIHELVVRDWTLRVDKAYGHYDLIKDTKTEDYQILYKRAIERGGILENQGASSNTKTELKDFLQLDIAAVMGEPGAFHNLNKLKTSDGRCLLTFSHEVIGEEYAALAVPKRSLLKPIIDNKLRWMRQMGVIDKYYQDSFGVKCFQDNLATSEPTALIITQLLGVFYLWAAGLILATLIFIMEIVTKIYWCGKTDMWAK